MLRVMVVGLGTMGAVHASSFMKMNDTKLTAVVDVKEERANEWGEKSGAKSFYSFDEAIREIGEEIDVISICVPTDLHPALVKKAADVKVSIICEKPLARSLEAAEEMVAYCRKQGVALFVGHVVRFFPEYQKAKQALDEGAVGKVGVVRTTRGGSYPIATEDWYANTDRSGGLVLDLMVHDFDFLRWCFGEVERVYARNLAGVAGINEERKDYALVTLRFANGVIAHLEGTWAHEGFRTSFELAGKEGILHYDSQKNQALVAEKASPDGKPGVAVPESPLQHSPYYTELSHFIQCIQSGKEPIVTAEDALKAVEIGMAALQSIKEKKPITIHSQTVAH
ncbi:MULTISPECIES: Gfo/Idh/MocA family protein [Shouchella]|uniref:Gfo/Idh/MocA family oxidoreductase n=2 Tax=Shouchella TaxID=2893057 RepID=A0ABY7W7Q4_9BACI|nr:MULTISPECIES: Gfo/Idh/MocA family oxidoreductase [Shouchella]MED4128176.1 Gfo/Idh/MocA family oxidoreductase [Shouchella miscanthi]WDF04972.1 Gfo/Idh/MocA family oxidoreductase [Shouchella hunanensis]